MSSGRPSALDPARRIWRSLPAPLRRKVGTAIGPARRALALARGRQDLGTRPAAITEPLIVLGFHEAVLGLGEGARLQSAAFRDLGLSTVDLDAAALLWSEEVPQLADLPSGGTIVSHINPPELTALVAARGAGLFRGRRHIGYWAWELPDLDRSWAEAFPFVDEIWCPSRFTAEAVSRATPAAPVSVLAHPLFVRPPARADRSAFGFADEDIVVLSALDLRSTEARKNAIGALQVVERLRDDRLRFVCKVTGHEEEAETWRRLQSLAAAERVTLISERLDRETMDRLIASADVVLSLHRAEGFGLLLAEAMRAGVPVVSTGWSGNMDFMDEESAALVPYELRPVDDPQGRYRNSVWAEPDLDRAEAALSRLLADEGARRALGAAGRRHIDRAIGREAWTLRARELGVPAPTSSARRTCSLVDGQV